MNGYQIDSTQIIYGYQIDVLYFFDSFGPLNMYGLGIETFFTT